MPGNFFLESQFHFRLRISQDGREFNRAMKGLTGKMIHRELVDVLKVEVIVYSARCQLFVP